MLTEMIGGNHSYNEKQRWFERNSKAYAWFTEANHTAKEW